jgi:hypothetical protein
MINQVRSQQNLDIIHSGQNFLLNLEITVEILYNTRRGIEGEMLERGNILGGIEIPDEHHTTLGLHLKPEKINKTRVTKRGGLYRYYKHSPKN